MDKDGELVAFEKKEKLPFRLRFKSFALALVNQSTVKEKKGDTKVTFLERIGKVCFSCVLLRTLRLDKALHYCLL